MIRLFDRLSDLLAKFGALAFFAIGLMLSYEVIARYIFNAPTIWAAELSGLAMIWGTFLAAGWLLHAGQHIRITLLTDLLPRQAQHRLHGAVLLLVAAFCGFVVWYGAPIAFDSFERGRTTGSMLNIPTFWSELAVPVGFGFLGIQALIEAGRSFLKGPQDPPATSHHESEL